MLGISIGRGVWSSKGVNAFVAENPFWEQIHWNYHREGFWDSKGVESAQDKKHSGLKSGQIGIPRLSAITHYNRGAAEVSQLLTWGAQHLIRNMTSKTSVRATRPTFFLFSMPY